MEITYNFIVSVLSMARRYKNQANKSQIVFDISGGDTSMQTMYLSTIPKPQNIVRSAGQNYSLRTDDIEGAKPSPLPKPHKTDLYYPDDIPGTKSKSNIVHDKPPTNLLKLDDIDGATPAIKRSLPHSQRHVNPVDPDYKLPEPAMPDEPPPKFVYNGFDYGDVEGSHPKSYKTDKPPRDTFKLDDIPGAQPKTMIKKFNGDRSLNVKDINEDGIFKTRRNTNPLFPDYYYDGQTYPRDFGIQSSNYKTRHDHLDLSLKTDDINGAVADSSTAKLRSFRPPENKDEDDYGKPAPVLMVPSMNKATLELEKKRAIDQKHGEVIRKFENRHLISAAMCADPAQGSLKQQRQANQYSRNPKQVTFTVTDADCNPV
ncbi:hypothetical protein TVAG_012570 [Trichomonas vaginalis G3]|uniref:Uncharacterized protein n=1 Tax=Trichomonas vaginalis (strain ATCC PRA-98 / G3) TaxID=412133 RepID=A2E907_TRIV3|nr:uncharacterized protein TVAGG3_1075340 [Trichomonas vaginalis G3]EAY10891.1 hypothetical protein TVAG_012570 [Trichomonas vaginalis G3]KAI5482938.1 hypothetical protein TVAGG3_1075340 [Trichomonas vaginalis G3]|eukprot:XP_001323114.1 hypothetical protein [Trichomonas vaginalis G3]